MPSAGDSRGRGRGILVLGSQFPGSRRKENARRQGASPGQSWIWADISGAGAEAANVRKWCQAQRGLDPRPGQFREEGASVSSSIKWGLGTEKPELFSRKLWNAQPPSPLSTARHPTKQAPPG